MKQKIIVQQEKVLQEKRRELEQKSNQKIRDYLVKQQELMTKMKSDVNKRLIDLQDDTTWSSKKKKKALQNQLVSIDQVLQNLETKLAQNKRSEPIQLGQYDIKNDQLTLQPKYVGKPTKLDTSTV